MVFREGDSNESERSEKIDIPTDEESTKIKLDDADEDTDDKGDSDDEPRAAKNGDQSRDKKSGQWAEKKAERGRDRKAAKAWESEKADMTRTISQMREDHERSIRQIREDMDRATRGSRQESDPISSRLTDVGAQIDRELALLQADSNRDYKVYNQLRREEQKLISLQAIVEREAEVQRVQRDQPADPYAARRPLIESEYPWVTDDRYRDLAQKARAYKEYLVKVEGRVDTIETDREALSHIQARSGREYGLNPPPAPPSERTRSLYGGPASRGTPDRRPAPREVDLGPLAHGHGLDPRTLAGIVRGVVDEE